MAAVFKTPDGDDIVASPPLMGGPLRQLIIEVNSVVRRPALDAKLLWRHVEDVKLLRMHVEGASDEELWRCTIVVLSNSDFIDETLVR